MTDTQRLLLWVGTTDDGLLADDISPMLAEMEAAGLLIRCDPIEYIQVFRTSAAGLEAMGVRLQ